jgi:glutamate-1-semialdehyde 2,1-aminomutase
MEEPGAYDTLEECSARLARGLNDAATAAGVAAAVNQIGSMVGMFFSSQPVTNYREATASDTAAYGTFFHAMLEQGVHLPPSQFEAFFVSLAHTPVVIDSTVKAAVRALEVSKTSK